MISVRKTTPTLWLISIVILPFVTAEIKDSTTQKFLYERSDGSHPRPEEKVYGPFDDAGQERPMLPPGSPWGYGLHNGPQMWGGQCRAGIRQSPIDIRASDVDYSAMEQLHFVNYDKKGVVTVENTGHGVQVGGFDRWAAGDRPYISGGELDGRYLLVQFHFHWAAAHDDGSEHTIASLHYPVELHLVHAKEGLTSEQTLRAPDGLAVVAVFINVGQDGSAWATLDTALRQVQTTGSSSRVFGYSPTVNLPTNLENFYCYSGSLTTPGCSESVLWTVLPEPVTITESQYWLLRNIRGNATHRLEFNNRPVQPVNGRRVQYRISSANGEQMCDGVRSWFSNPFSGTNGGEGKIPYSPMVLITAASISLALAMLMHYL